MHDYVTEKIKIVRIFIQNIKCIVMLEWFGCICDEWMECIRHLFQIVQLFTIDISIIYIYLHYLHHWVWYRLKEVHHTQMHLICINECRWTQSFNIFRVIIICFCFCSYNFHFPKLTFLYRNWYINNKWNIFFAFIHCTPMLMKFID